MSAATLERLNMDGHAEQNEQTDYLSNPRQTLEKLAKLHKQAGMHPDESDKLAEIHKVVGEISHQLDLQKASQTVPEEASKAA